jgi:hypothetical protein
MTAFRYSPVVAVGCAPLALLSHPVGSAVLRLVTMLVLLIGLVWWGAKLFRSTDGPKGWGQWMLLTALAGGSSLLDIQFNVFYLGLILIALAAMSEGRWNLAALALALAVCCKVYPISLALLLIVIHPRRFGPRFAVAMLLLLALPFVFQHPGYVTAQYLAWPQGGLSPERTCADFQDVMYLWQRYVGAMNRGVFLVLSAAAGALLALIAWWRRHQLQGDAGLICLSGMGLIWMLAFGPATEGTTYVVLAPIGALAAVAALQRRLPLWSRALGATAYGLLALSTLQLVLPINKPLIHIGAQPFAALLLLPVFACWHAPAFENRPAQTASPQTYSDPGVAA